LNLLPVNVHESLIHAIGNIAQECNAKGIAIEQDLEATDDGVFADAGRLQQVFWNVLRNAVNFTPEGGRIKIRTTHDAAARHLTIEISDNGVGIPADVLPRIFDAFVQGEGRMTREFGGLDLGLAIARSVVELHGGTISAASDGLDRGAKFTIVLPSATEGARGAKRITRRRAAASEGEAQISILLVDGHIDTLRVTSQLLKRSGFAVTTAESVDEAAALATANSFDVLVTDIGLPDGTGYDLMRGLRETSGIRGVALSGYAMQEDIRKSREAGFDVHLVKPVNGKQLEEVILRLMETS